MKRKFKDESCSICLKNIHFRSVLNPCLHEFCIDCIGNWLCLKLICPLCKQIPKYLFYNLQNDIYASFFKLNPSFDKIWQKRSNVLDFFNSRSTKIQKLGKILRLILNNYSYPVDFLRKMTYFCEMRTHLRAYYKVEWDPATLFIDHKHRIWDWVCVELSVFFSISFIRNWRNSFESSVLSYTQLKTAINTLITNSTVSERFIMEMDTFLSFFDSCENYYYMKDIKYISSVLVEDKYPTVLIDKNGIQLRKFSRLLSSKIFHLESTDINVYDDNMRPIHELSHIINLYEKLIVLNAAGCSDWKDESMKLLMEFVELRISRKLKWPSVSRGRNRMIKNTDYRDYFNLNNDYRFIYLTCFHDAKQQLNNNITKESETIDLTAAKMPKIVIDLTYD